MKLLLDKYMYEHNLTIWQVEIMTGVSKSTIHNIINNPKINVVIVTLEFLAKGLKIRISDLYSSYYK